MSSVPSGVTVRMVASGGEILSGWGASRHFGTLEEARAWIEEVARRNGQRAVDLHVEED
jgi:hypothetical protein